MDAPLVWHGVPPKDVGSYWIQQGRWSLGGFQLIPALMKSRVELRQFLDYLAGALYWLHVGPLLIADVIAPALVLLFDLYYLRMDPLAYLLVYVPAFSLGITYYMKAMRRYNYRPSEFFIHHAAHVLVSIPVTLSFISALLRRRVPFRTTPKSGSRSNLVYSIPFILMALALSVGIIRGVLLLASGLPAAKMWAVVVNAFWAAWWLTFTLPVFWIIQPKEVPREVRSRIKQNYDFLVHVLAIILRCASSLEDAVGKYYLRLSRKFDKYFERLGEDSLRHRDVYRLISARVFVGDVGINVDEALVCRSYFELMEKVSRMYARCQENPCLCLMPEEEIHMRLVANMSVEMLETLVDEESLDKLRKIASDEVVHERIIEGCEQSYPFFKPR